MGRYDDKHSKTDDWAIEKPINDLLNIRDREVHRVDITDKDTGRTGSGSGWTHRDAHDEAWDDLNDND